MTDRSAEPQRLDKWLWCARFFRSRALAGKMLSARRLRLSGKIVTKAHQPVRPGDVLTFPQGSDIRVVRVVRLAERRGPAPEAQTLYDDLQPPVRPTGQERAHVEVPEAQRHGRPTKGERRALEKLRGRYRGGNSNVP